jgi:hypothetical protein
MSWHIFYTDSTKEIAWSSNADVTNAIKTEQKDTHGYDYIEVTQDDVPSGNDWIVKSDKSGIEQKTVFNPTFSTLTPALEGVINVTGLPTGTEVFLDGVSAGTMSDTTLTLTATEPGSYKVKFSKLGYKVHQAQTITVKRYGE